MADTSIEIQANLGHYFKQGLINPEVAQRIWGDGRNICLVGTF